MSQTHSKQADTIQEMAKAHTDKSKGSRGLKRNKMSSSYGNPPLHTTSSISIKSETTDLSDPAVPCYSEEPQYARKKALHRTEIDENLKII